MIGLVVFITMAPLSPQPQPQPLPELPENRYGLVAREEDLIDVKKDDDMTVHSAFYLSKTRKSDKKTVTRHIKRRGNRNH